MEAFMKPLEDFFPFLFGKSKLKEGILILVGIKDDMLIFREYNISCLFCGNKTTIDFGNIGCVINVP